MSKFGSEIVIVLVGIVFCIGALQTEGIAKVETEIPVPKDGFTIVLRAPTSENPRIIKVSKDRKGVTKEESIQGLRVYLPENTPVFFRVDQVNTILYDVNITGTSETSKVQSESLGQQPNKPAAVQKSNNKNAAPDTGTSNTGKTQKSNNKSEASGTEAADTLEIIDILTSIVDKSILEQSTASKIQAAEKALKVLQRKLHQARALDSKLDDILYRSEMPEFSGFGWIKSEAVAAAKEKFKRTEGTSQELWEEAEQTLTAVYKAGNDIQKDLLVHLPKHLSVLTELCDPTNEKAQQVLNVFAKTVKKLRRIETAKWYKNDKQERVLKKNIQYNCVITPAMKPPEGYPELRSMEFVVIVNNPKLSGRTATFGSFLTRVRDDTYVNVDGKIAIGVQDRFAEGFGILTHIPLYSYNVDRLKFLKFRGAIALSGGLGLDDIFNSAGKFSLTQLSTLLGGSVLFAAPESESLLALTAGRSLRPVERLNGYSVGNAFPEQGGVTRPVRTSDWFFALTVSYDIRQLLEKPASKAAQK